MKWLGRLHTEQGLPSRNRRRVVQSEMTKF